MVRRLLVLVILTLFGGGACDSRSRSGEASPPTVGVSTTAVAPSVPAPAPAGPDLGAARPRLQRVADVEQPTAMAVRPGDDALYVAEKGGRVRAVPGGQSTEAAVPAGGAVLDISDQVSDGSEQGLLGLAFSPDGTKLYIDYTDTEGDTHVVEYAFAGGRADPATRRELLFVDQPFSNHNGGQLSFGPDGKLYIGLGDGGGSLDPQNRAQNLGDLLGKVLRIEPSPSGGRPYTVPPDNPFVGRDGARPEIWLLGLRNPWRFSWDRQTADLWIGDVGQNDWEEIDYLPAGTESGANLGWSRMDSMHRLKGDNPPGATLPIFEYGHEGGNCSITGGYVYRGAKVPALNGAYIYGDACSGKVWGLVQREGRVELQQELQLTGLDEAVDGGGYSISSFGEDSAGELYLLSLNGGVYRFET